MDKQYQVIVSRSENYMEYYIISSYDILEQAEQNMNSDIDQFAKQNHKWWLCEYPRYHAVIKNPDYVM